VTVEDEVKKRRMPPSDDYATQESSALFKQRDASINYEGLRTSSGDQQSLAAVRAHLQEELPYAWADRYARWSPHATNLVRIDLDGFEYVFDEPSGLVATGALAQTNAVQDRLVGVHGLSRVAQDDRSRSRSRLGGAPTGTAERVDDGTMPYDRGHMMAHSIGGGLDINLVPQLASVNRFGLWRRMERYAQSHPGSYVFCSPVYFGRSGHPAFIEYGVLRDDCTIWLNVFRNYRTEAELEEVERLYCEATGRSRTTP
jgi:hypothetical protein